MKTIVTIVGIRPDFIRMAEIFKKLDKNFNHILIHTGQHFDKNLSSIYFDQLGIRQPDYNLQIGGPNKEHYHQSAELFVKIIDLFKSKNINPDIILFLGDSNSVMAASVLKKEGYKIGHIEAGMRSGDKRMLEEINRTICDHCSDYLFVYHKNYKHKLLKENISKDKIFVVGNTIVESCSHFIEKIFEKEKLNSHILLDIHRPENFKYVERMEWIINYATKASNKFNKPVKMLNFKRTLNYINQYNIDMSNIEVIELMDYGTYLQFVYDSIFIISDSGTAQEEPALLNTKVIVPRDFTERPESIINNCSFMLNKNNFNESFKWINAKKKMNLSWLGNGKTSDKVIEVLQNKL